MVFLHEVLGKDLAALDDSGVLPGAEAGDPGLLQDVHGPQDQGIVGGHHGEVHGVGPGKGQDAGDVGGRNAGALRVGGNAAVAGQGEDPLRPWVLLQFFDDGVLAAARTDYKNFHLFNV